MKFQLPNEHTRVSNLIDEIENSDVALQAAVASSYKTEFPGDERYF